MRRRSVIAVVGCVTASALASTAPPLTAANGLVSVKVPPRQTVNDLRNQLFFQTVTCTKACDLTTTVSIPLADARRLGYKSPASRNAPIVVASSYVRLKAKTPTEVRLVVNADGKKLLPREKGRLRVIGKLIAIQVGNTEIKATAGWQSLLK